MAGEVLRPKFLVLPKYSTTERDLMVAEIGTLIYNTTTSKLNYSITAAAGAGSWSAITSEAL